MKVKTRRGNRKEWNDVMKPLQSQQVGDVVAVRLHERKILHEATIRMLGNELNEMALAASVNRKYLNDFRNVVTMSSMMISAILKLQKRCKRDKIKLKFV